MKWKVDSQVWDQKGVNILKKCHVLFLARQVRAASLDRAEPP